VNAVNPRSVALLIGVVTAAVVGFVVISYMLSHVVFGYVTCDGPPPPPEAFDVVGGNGCWSYRMPWP